MTNENSPLMEARVHGYCTVADVGCRNIQQQQVACMRTLLSKNHLDGYMNHRMLGRMNRICPKNIFTNPTLTAAIYDSRNMTHDLTIENCPIPKLSDLKTVPSQNCLKKCKISYLGTELGSDIFTSRNHFVKRNQSR